MFELIAVTTIEILGLMMLQVHIKNYFQIRNGAIKRAKLKQKLRGAL